MTPTIAIQPDDVRHKNGEHQSYSARWTALAKDHGFSVRHVDVYSSHLFADLIGCDAFMWRFGYDALSLQLAKRLLPAIEHGLRIPVFPSWATAWHFEDKVSQHFLLSAAGIPTPKTWVFWREEAALEFCRSAQYPLVFKLATGFQSNSVRLIRDSDEAVACVRRMFGPGITDMSAAPSRMRQIVQSQYHVVRLGMGRSQATMPRGIQHGYFYVQEFLAGNDFDTRVTVIGDRAYAFRRMNRPDDFRASGSGRIDWDPQEIDLATVRLAFRTARHFGTQSVAIDGLRRGDEPVIGEISYTFASWAIRDCIGHWTLEGEPPTGSLSWVPGTLRAEDAIFEDFVKEVSGRLRA